jgi:hypothetical protein
MYNNWTGVAINHLDPVEYSLAKRWCYDTFRYTAYKIIACEAWFCYPKDATLFRLKWAK